MKRKWIVIALVCAFVLLAGSALATRGAAGQSLDELRAIAVGTPARLQAPAGWGEVVIDKETPLYDFDEELVAYCFDLSEPALEENAYVIVGADAAAAPVWQYGTGGRSPWYGLDAGLSAVYGGVERYYGVGPSNYVELSSGTFVSKEAVRARRGQASADALAGGPDSGAPQADYESLRTALAEGGPQTRNITAAKNLTAVPLYQWAVGCSPTAMAMILGYHYGEANLYASLPSYLGTTRESRIIAGLGTFMETTSPPAGGGTGMLDILDGTVDFLDYCGEAWTLCEYASTESNGSPKWGKTENPWGFYKTELNADRPVFVTVRESTYVTGGYPGGFGTHTMAGVGYTELSTGERFMILHTTSRSDGDCYVDFDSEALKDHCWLYFEP